MVLYVTAIHTFVAEHADELEFQGGDRIEVLERDEAFGDGWWKGRNTKGDEGLFPATYISEDPDAVPAGAFKKEDAAANGDDEALATPVASEAVASPNNDHSSLFNPGPEAVSADRSLENDHRDSLLDVTGAPRGTALVTTDKGAGNNVMDRTIGEVQEAIDTMGGPSPARTPEAPVQKGYQLKDPQEASREDDDDVSDGEGAIGINSDARARLAAQAKLANEERDRQHQRESGGLVADLIYSDESDDDEEGSAGSRRASRGYRGLSLNGTHTTQTASTSTTIAERIEDEDLDDPPKSQTLAAAVEPAPVPAEDLMPAPTAQPPTTQASIPTAPTPPQPKAAMWSPVPYPPVSQFSQQQQSSAQTVTMPPSQPSADEAPPPETSSAPAAEASHTPSTGVFVAAGAGAAALAGVGAAALASGSGPSSTAVTSAQPYTSPNLTSGATMADPILPSPGSRTSSLPRGSPLMNTSNLPVVPPSSQPASLPAGAAPPATITPRLDQAAQLQPALPISSPATPGVAAAVSPAASSPGVLSPDSASRMPAKPPMTWTVDEVVEWARSRGFDDGVCNKFVEQDITGDVLLELDANLLKELDIPQLGKRLRIAAAINELRRPPSAVSNKASQLQTQQTPQSASPGPPPAPPMPDTQHLSQVPPQAPTHSQTASQSSSLRGFAMVPPAFVGQAAQSTPPLGTTSPVIDDHHNVWSHGRKVSVTPTTQSIDESKAVDGPIITNGDGHGRGHSQSASISLPASSTAPPSHTASRSTSSIPATPATTATTGTGAKENLMKRESTSSLTGHKKKGSVDKTDRLSFFGRNRKAPPPAGSGNASPVGPERSASSRMTFSGGQKPAMQTMTADKPDGTSATPSAGVGAALRQIGKPDKVGYLKKRGERYNTWKTRYFVLKGSHLYYLKSENEDRVKGHIDLKGHRIIVDENTNPGNYGFRLVGPGNDNKPHFFSSSDRTQVRDWMKSLMKATIARDYSVPVTSSCNIPTIPLAEAQALQPRPPSPAQREATQRATRRENVNQLTPRDASVLMSLDTSGSGKRMTSHGSSLHPSPSRPDRDTRRPSTGKETMLSRTSMAISDRRSVNSYYGQPETEEQAELLKWVNQTLPPQYPRAAHFPSSFMSGEVILLLVKHLSGIEPNPPVPSSAFAPDATGLPNVEGLLAMGETVIDAGVDSAGVSLNEIRAGDVQAITHLLETVRSWAQQKGYA
ncbi:hypothetical protein CcaverHIS002_0310950 [Cutaneotrichosporon cavernicola]|uniref:PH-domain-containing protein n=1 Tax=Cutaneotrichosporon cavernicola TaxID=279322 RepID=A0AA48L303_9TREE|nr:uncharacterized protein CcaverHIS019_0310810 [Cutaneotrichosporon cavernicola]BEI83227.1 hypothetical protein CcaverHIS002_0310950 [Cutaneotrichosporon cavernicola]BEI91011.1 hypothetical protein CcaverHIS019_0310810 [Cutaneotrichosporon cavernicola]BEI98790.1 hypothetical protein CcaverHIS631_0310890 [Cutaneotrichosporon cavernicola]BEJ06561.1 hypothetical protein CcaverHIS641_0310830 [Cutaneotrichosporon cavernicola]